MKSFLRLTTLLVALTSAKLLGAVTYSGTVTSVEGDTAKVAMSGSDMPPVGTRGEFFFKIDGSDVEVSVATGSALKIDHSDLLVKIENATGTVEQGHLVRFTFERSATSAALAPVTNATPGQTDSPPVAATETLASPTPTESHRHFLEGLTKLHAREWKGALAEFNKALELDPTDAKSMANRASVYVELKQPKRALAEVNEAIRLNPNISTAYVIRGYCYSDLGQLKRALEEYDEALRLDPRNTQALNARGIIHILLKQTKIAVEDLTQAIAVDPAYLAAYQNRAECYKILGKSQLAKQDQAKIRELKAAAK